MSGNKCCSGRFERKKLSPAAFHSADREDVHCADRKDVHCADSCTPIHEGIHTGGRREAPPPCVEAARSAASFMDGCVAVAEAEAEAVAVAVAVAVCTMHIFPVWTMHMFPLCTMRIFLSAQCTMLPCGVTSGLLFRLFPDFFGVVPVVSPGGLGIVERCSRHLIGVFWDTFSTDFGHV